MRQDVLRYGECRKRGTVEKTYAWRNSLWVRGNGKEISGRADSIRPVFPDSFFLPVVSLMKAMIPGKDMFSLTTSLCSYG